MDNETEIGDIEFPPGIKNVSSDMNPAELVKALKKCCKFFSQLEQDEEDSKRKYLPFCHYIVQDEFLKETKDDNCRIHIGCILADIFRLHAPENPFRSGEKIKEIFLFVTEQLRHLKDSKGPLFPKAYHILENVATIKSFNICIDLDDSEAAGVIFCSLFKTLFSTVNSGHDKQLKTHMLDIMGFAITDSGTISQPLLDIILECLLEKSQNMNPSAFELAKDLLRRTSAVAEQFLMVFFHNVLLSNRQDSSRLSAHWPRLIPELYKISPSLLLNTLPQLELKLRVDDPKERLQMVNLLSRMFSEKDSDLAAQYPTLWNCFLGRFNDIDIEVRCKCVSFCRNLIINHGKEAAFCREAMTFFKPRRHDTEESVRIAVVLCIRGITMSDLQLASDEFLEFLKDRVMDKKWHVREASIRAMADIYKKYCTGEGTSRMNIRRLQVFRSRLLNVYYRRSLDDCILLERVMVSSLVPYTLSNAERMKLLLELFVTVDDHAVKALVEMLKKQSSLRLALIDILEAYELPTEEEQNRVIWPKVVFLASQMPGNMQTVRENVKKFVRLVHRDKKMQQWLTYIVSSNYTSQKVAVAVRDLLKKLDADGVAKPVKMMTQLLLERAVIVPVLIDPSCMKLLFDLVKESLDGVSDIDQLNGEESQIRAMELLKNISEVAPHLFSSVECYEQLLGFLRRTRDEYVVDNTLVILKQTASVIEKNFTDIRSVLLPELKTKAKSGTPRQAKYAVYCINQFESVREAPLMQVFDHCKELASSTSTSCLQMQTILTSLGCIAEVLPDKAAGQLRTVIASVVVKQVIMKTGSGSSTPNPGKGKKKEQKWCEKYEISRESKTKIAGMKCMVRWLHGLCSNDFDCCGSTLRLLQHMLHNDGDLMKSGSISKADMSHLRLQAAYCVLKIAQISAYDDLFKPAIFQELAMLINDSVLEVRKNFVTKLFQAIFRLKIHISFLSLFALVSQETLKEQRDKGTYFYHQLIQRLREFNKQSAVSSSVISTMMPEYMIPYLVYLLGTDPDFLEGISKRSLARLKDSIHFILDPILTKDHPESFGFVKRLAENLKRTKNADKPNDNQKNENIFAVCDLIVQHILQRSSQHAVAIIEPDDKSVIKYIPTRLFTKPAGPENNKIYLPREFYANLKPVPTVQSTAALGGDKYKKHLSHQGTRKMATPVLSSPTSPQGGSDTPSSPASSQTPTRPVKNLRQTSILSSMTSTTSSLPTPPTSQTTTSQESVSKPAQPAVRTSGRKRKPRNLSPSPPPSNAKQARLKKLQKRLLTEEDSVGDEASNSESATEEENVSQEESTESESGGKQQRRAPSSRNKAKEDVSTKTVAKGGRAVVASASVKTAKRKQLQVKNGNLASPSTTASDSSVRRSNRRRGK
uniref:Sister chromatid cohesion protein PDS5 homolog A-B-like n=1 Tax=Phallusia mammillata TaxID=59560 RepID=A0A6F9DMT4_9ASCI|nr:sister chromatid cohesion protein PDS5 homolog A-B-like [Phallusia mammillata]